MNWTTTDAYNKGIVVAFLDTEYPSDRSLLNGLYMTAVASFEEHLRQCVINAILTKLASNQSLEGQNLKLIHRNIRSTGRYLVDGDLQSESQKIFEACRNLATCIPGSSSIELNLAEIAKLGRIIELESYLECLVDVGYDLKWASLVKDSALQAILKSKGTKETEKVLKQALREIRKNRNSIAHSGPTSANISE
jgi:hypothetical protein